MRDSRANMTAIVKDGPPREVYVIFWPDSRNREALQQLGRWASKEDLSLTWYDVARCSHRIAQHRT